MQAVGPYRPGKGSAPELVEWPTPVPGPGELLLEVAATALNRADLLQLRGLYPPPEGASPIPGLEAAGVVRAVGPGVESFRIGDRVMALLAGGGHAQWAVAPAGCCLPVPPGVTLLEAAAIMEAGVTTWCHFVEIGRCRTGERVLVTGASSGVGTYGIALARELGLRVIAVSRRVSRLEERFARLAHRVELDDRLPEEVRRATGGEGVDLVFDLVGGSWVPKLLETLRPGGRYLLVGLVAGRTATIDLTVLLRKRVQWYADQLRSRPLEEKASLVSAFGAFVLPALASGRLRPTLARVFPWERIGEAYGALEAGGHVGKLVIDLTVGRS